MKISVSANVRYQSGLIPFRITDNGIEILLISKTHSRKWGVPKGGVELELKLKENAAKEAYEEAGIEGVVGSRLGIYYYTKGSTGKRQAVFMYPMRVRKLLDSWPEKHRRERQWFTVEQCKSVLPRSVYKLVLALSSKYTQ